MIGLITFAFDHQSRLMTIFVHSIEKKNIVAFYIHEEDEYTPLCLNRERLNTTIERLFRRDSTLHLRKYVIFLYSGFPFRGNTLSPPHPIL